MQTFIKITLFSLLIFSKVFAQDLPNYLTEEEKALLPFIKYSPASTNGTNPPGSPVRTMAEWEELQGLQITWTSQTAILRQIVDYAQEEVVVYIVCSDSNTVKANLTANGIPLTNIVYVQTAFNSIWCRDYGPWSVYKNEVDSLYIVDWIYNRPTRPLDDATPVTLANLLNVPIFQTTTAPYNFIATGGNFMADGNGTAFSSNLIINENPTQTVAQIDTIVSKFMGISRYIKMSTLPYDQIHHIDMHMKLLDEETLLVGEYPQGVSDGPQIEANLQYVLNNFQTCYGRPYKVVRIPMPPHNGQYPSTGGNYRTYTNSVFVNKTVIVPTYELAYDTTAIRIYQQALPGYNIVGINCNSIIPSLGAIHCITKEIGTSEPIFISHAKLSDQQNATANPYEVKTYLKTRTGIASAQVFWSTDTTQGFNILQMTQTPGDTFVANIPIQQFGTKVHYYISATSNSGKTITKPLVAPTGNWSFNVTGLAPIVAVSAPNGNENWQAETLQNITWVSYNVNNVLLEFTTDGTNWQTIGTAPSIPNSYSWFVPNTPSTTCKIRVTDTNNPNLTDESNNFFTISPPQLPSLTLLSPNGNEKWEVGTSQEIIWLSSNVGSVLIEYTTNGTIWQTVATVSGENYTWTVPNTTSITCKVRISDASNFSVQDVSDNNFTIFKKVIAVVSPNGGENWQNNSVRTILWASTHVDTVKIEFTPDNEVTWFTLAEKVNGNLGNFNWSISTVPANRCKIKISDATNPALYDLSNNFFTIFEPSVTLLTPNGNENWQVGTEQQITWVNSNVNAVKLDFTTDGTTWQTIATVPSTPESYTWTVPNTPSTACKVKISDLNNSNVTDQSDENFKISTNLPTKTLTLVSPAGEEFWEAGTLQNIVWESQNVDSVKLELFVDGQSVQTIAEVPASQQIFVWSVPDNQSSECKIKISDTKDATLFDFSTLTFTIFKPTLSLIFPNGNEILRANTLQTILWQSTNLQTVLIELTTDGTTWQTLTTVTVNIGVFAWTVPEIFSDKCKVRVSNPNNPSLKDESEGFFTVVNPTITLVSPLGSEKWRFGTEQEVSFTSQGVQTVKIEFSADNTNWSLIGSGEVSAGNFVYVWNVPTISSKTCKIKVSDEDFPEIFDESGNFEIIPIYVYPGDANNDGTVNLADVQTIETFFNTTGQARAGNFTWEGQGLWQNWENINACFADCDGNGKVEAKDVEAVILNWNATQESSVVPNTNKVETCNKILSYLEENSGSPIKAELQKYVTNFMAGTLGVVFNYKLSQNFPNPFNPTTKISFTLPAEEKVTVKIYNLNGQLVRNLFSGNGKLGKNFVVWNGADENGKLVASGVYLYKLEAKSFSEVRKMTFLK